MRFVAEALRLLEPIAVTYGLRAVAVGGDRVLLLGEDYAIQLLADFDTVHVAFIERSARGASRMVGLDAYLTAARFTAEDRAQFGTPIGREAHVDAALRVIVSGLGARCADILQGDREWLHRLRRRDPVRWQGALVDASLASVFAG